MKTVCNFILGLFLVTLSVQLGPAQDISIGPRVSLNLARQLGDVVQGDVMQFIQHNFAPEQEIDVKNQLFTGLQGGGVVLVGLADNFALQSGLLYSLQGGNEGVELEIRVEREHNIDVVPLVYIGTYTQGYFKVPILGKLYFEEVGKSFNIQMGVEISFLLHAKTEVEVRLKKPEFGNLSTEEIKQINNEFGYNKSSTKTDMYTNNFGAIFGVGYDFGSGLAIDLRYNLSFTNLIDKDEFEEEIGKELSSKELSSKELSSFLNIGDNIRSAVLSVSVTYLFDLR